LVISRIPIRVECYTGSRSEERPLALHWGGERFEVVEILDRWYQGNADSTVAPAAYFKVRVRGGQTFIVRHEPLAHAWFLVGEVGLAGS
jgi:hypothetical protein